MRGLQKYTRNLITYHAVFLKADQERAKNAARLAGCPMLQVAKHFIMSILAIPSSNTLDFRVNVGQGKNVGFLHKKFPIRILVLLISI